MVSPTRSPGAVQMLVSGFVAGFFATLLFHQLTLALLWGVGLAPFAPFSMATTQPFGVPAVFSLAFWGGVWGCAFALIDNVLRRLGNYWVAVFLFGAILPSVVAFLVVFPLKGRAMGGASLVLTAFLVNGAWGIGTALILKLLLRRSHN